jgi:putative transposase
LSLDVLEQQIIELRNEGYQSKPESRKAKKYLIEQMLARGFKQGEIVDHLGISRKTIYNLMKSQL